MFRWILIAVFVVNGGISAYYRRKARQAETIARTEEGALLVLLRLVFALPLFLPILAYMINPAWMDWSSVSLPVWLRWGGAVLGVGVMPLMYWIFSTIGRNISETVLTKKTHELVTSGPYRWVRHPLYAVFPLMSIAISLLAANWFIGGMTLLALVMIVLVVIPKEEANLIEAFGDEYRAYMKRTGRLLPRLRASE